MLSNFEFWLIPGFWRLCRTPQMAVVIADLKVHKCVFKSQILLLFAIRNITKMTDTECV